MLAHFHFLNKGVVPFSLPQTESGRKDLAKAANLTEEEVEFVWRTANLVKDPQRGESGLFREVGSPADVIFANPLGSCLYAICPPTRSCRG